MERNSCIFYRSFYESIKELEPEQQVKIYDAIFQYEFDGTIPELTGVCKSIFTLIIPQLEANDKKYINGCKGGRPKNNQNETKTKPNKNLKGTKTKANDNENDNDNDNDIKKEINKEKYFQNDLANNLFVEFLQVRKKLKAVNSERAIKSLITKLEKYDDETKCKMIEQSIVSSWKDVYELKEDKKTPKWFNKEIEEKGDLEKQKELERVLGAYGDM